MPEPILLAAGLALAAALVAVPILGVRAPHDGPIDEDREAAQLRHRLALEELRDLEADRRAGTLDPAAYAEQLAEAEARAVATRRALGAAPSIEAAPALDPAGRRLALAAGAAIALAVLVGSLVPAAGIANSTETNRALAEAEAREAIRQERIGDLLATLEPNPRQPEVLSDLADAYLEGASDEDLAAAVTVLQALLTLDPQRSDAYQRTVAAYLRAGDVADARSALAAYAELPGADPIELAFLEGLVARAAGDEARAAAAFERFLELAPDDPRATMVESLLEEVGS